MPFGKKIVLASFNKIPTNFISVESLINVLYEKNTNVFFWYVSGGDKAWKDWGLYWIYLVSDSAVRANWCTVLFTRHQSTKVCRAFSVFWLVIEIFTSKVRVAKNMRDMLHKWTPREKCVKYQNFPTLVFHYPWNVVTKSHDNPSNLYTL